MDLVLDLFSALREHNALSRLADWRKISSTMHHQEQDVCMTESTINAKGQTTVPAKIRKRFGCAPGTRLDWHVLDDGRLMLRVMTSTRTVKKS